MVLRTPVTRVPGGPAEDLVVVEEPLEIRVEGRTTMITMRTPGQDLDLARGFLWTEGVIDGVDDITALATVGENVVDVRLAEGVPAARARSADRAWVASSACGVCGSASIERLRRAVPPPAVWQPTDAVLFALPEAMRAAQPIFAQTGGLHGAALFDANGGLAHVREDVGRHNAVDKVLGAWLADPGADTPRGLVVTSRSGFEIVQKALCAGVGVIVAFGAPSSLAIEAAAAAGAVLIAWLRPDRYVRLA